MNNYIKILGTIKGVADALFPEALFLSATWDQMSQESYGVTDKIVIGLNQGFVITQGGITDSTSSATVIIDFGLPDQYDDNSTQQFNVIASAEVVAGQFLEALNGVQIDSGLAIGQFRIVPYYKKWGLTLSGVAIELNLVIGQGCETFPSIEEYIEYIGRNISPSNWGV